LLICGTPIELLLRCAVVHFQCDTSKKMSSSHCHWTIAALRKDTSINVSAALSKAAAIVGRRFAGVFAKGRGKRARLAKSNIKSNFRHRQLARRQQGFGPFDSSTGQVRRRGPSRRARSNWRGCRPCYGVRHPRSNDMLGILAGGALRALATLLPFSFLPSRLLAST